MERYRFRDSCYEQLPLVFSPANARTGAHGAWYRGSDSPIDGA